MYDKANLFSDSQAITATANSTDLIDLGSDRNIGVGRPVGLAVRITEDFNNLDNLDIEIQTSDELDGGGDLDSADTLATVTIAAADLVQGYKTPHLYLPRGVRRYLRLRYVVDGSNPSEGEIHAGLVLTQEDWKPYPGVTGRE